jgi:hypothetical protein
VDNNDENNPNAFELPVAEHNLPPRRLTFEHAVKLCEDVLAWELSRPEIQKRREQARCLEEFIL